jgi:hypothetical protein
VESELDEIVGVVERIAAAESPAANRSITISGYALRAALEFVAPDTDADQLEAEVSIQYGEAGHSGAGYYCCLTEYPEEGSILLPDGPEPEAKDGAA